MNVKKLIIRLFKRLKKAFKTMSFFQMAAIAAGVIILIAVMFNLVRGAVSGVKTETALEYTANDSVIVKGYFVRKEQILTAEKEGVIVPIVEDGTKVTKNEQVALSCNAVEDAEVFSGLNLAEDEKQRLENINAIASDANVTPEILNNNIVKAVNGIVDQIGSGSFYNIQSSFRDFRDAAVKKQVLIGKDIDFASLISSTDDEIASLEAKGYKGTPVTTDVTGYYVSGVDGFESVYDTDKISDITISEVEALFSAKPAELPDNTMGKLVTGYEWYIVCTMKREDLYGAVAGTVVKVDFPYSSNKAIRGKIKAVNTTDGKNVAVVISCGQMNKELANMRQTDIEIIFNSYTGYKIPAKAVREEIIKEEKKDENGKKKEVKKEVKGVYILRFNTVTFRSIDIIYEGNGFVLVSSKQRFNEEGIPIKGVKIYDEVVVRGKNLHDGKTVY